MKTMFPTGARTVGRDARQGISRSGGSIACASAALLAVTAWATACGDGGTPPQPNRAPVAQGSIPAQTVSVGDTVLVSVASAFSDPDGDALTFSAASSAPDVASVTVSGTNVSVTGVSAGTTTITITASDPGGLTASQALGVTVVERVDICGRTPQIRDGIVEAAGASSCESVTAADLAGIQRLRFNRVGLESLRQGDFDGLTGLESLGISGNGLVSLPEAVFVGLESLTSLSLDENRLTSISNNAFSGLTALEWLSLGDNQLASLPDEVFAELTSLEQLSLSDNELASLRPNVFSGLNNVYNLFLTGNELVSLEDGGFANLESLTWLVLAHNRLTSISNDSFVGLNNLHSLNLENNELTSLPDGVFSRLTGLESLHLHNNRLTSLPRGIFAGLDRLYALWLQSNQLESLPVGLFSGLHLQSVLLYDNHLSSLPEGVFADMSTGGIDLSKNRLTSLPEGVFSGLEDLEGLSLNANHLESLPSGIFSGLSSLQALFLNDNQLDSLPEGIFSGLPGFEILWLDDNPGVPFEFGVQFDRIDGPNGAASPDSVRLVLAEGAPFNLTVPLAVQNGTLSTTSATLPTGNTAGPALLVTQVDSGQSTVLTATGTPPDLHQDPRFEGFTIGWPAELVLFSSGRSGTNHGSAARGWQSAGRDSQHGAARGMLPEIARYGRDDTNAGSWRIPSGRVRWSSSRYRTATSSR